MKRYIYLIIFILSLSLVNSAPLGSNFALETSEGTINFNTTVISGTNIDCGNITGASYDVCVGVTANASTLNVNSSNYWDGLNTPADINAADITDDGTYITSASESTLNVNSSDFWDNLDTTSDLNDTHIHGCQNITGATSNLCTIVDTDTTYSAGTGLTLTGTTFNLLWVFLSNFTDDLGDRGYNSLSNFTDDLGDRGYNSLSNFTDDLGDRGYNSLSNFTNNIDLINSTYANSTYILQSEEGNLNVNSSDFWDSYGTQDELVNTHNHSCLNITGATSNLCTITDTTYTATAPYMILTATAFSWNESKGNQTYVNVDGDTMEADLSMGGYNLTNIGEVSRSDGSALRVGCQAPFSGCDSAWNLHNNETVGSGVVTHTMTNGDGVNATVNMALGLGGVGKGAYIRNSGLFFPDFGIQNESLLRDINYMWDLLGIIPSLTYHSSINKTSLAVQFGVETQQVHIHNDVNNGLLEVEGDANFILGTNEDLDIIGTLHLRESPRLVNVTQTSGTVSTITNETFESGTLNTYTATTTGGGANEWDIEASLGDCPFDTSDFCSMAGAGDSGAVREMVSNISTLNETNLALYFDLNTVDMTFGTTNFTVYMNNNNGSGDVKIYNLSGTNVLDTSISNTSIPSSMDNKSIVSIILRFSGTHPTRGSVFVDNIAFTGNATSTVTITENRYDSIFKVGDGTQQFAWNDTDKDMQFENISFNDGEATSFNAVTLTKNNVDVATVNDLTGASNITANTIIPIINKQGSTLTKGTPVYFDGYDTTSSKSEVTKAVNTATTTHADCFILETLSNNTEGQCIVSGIINNTDVSNFGLNDELYLNSSAGTLTSIKPVNAVCIQRVGMVTNNATDGSIWVNGVGRCNDVPSSINITGNITANSIISQNIGNSTTVLLGDGASITNIGDNAETQVTRIARINEVGGIQKCQAVYISGATGDKPQVSLADNQEHFPSHIVGLAAETGANNNNILIRLLGEVTGCDTSNFTEGCNLHLSQGGNMSCSQQVNGSHLHVGVASKINVASGIIEVKPDTYMHDIRGTTQNDVELWCGSGVYSNIGFYDYSGGMVMNVNCTTMNLDITNNVSSDWFKGSLNASDVQNNPWIEDSQEIDLNVNSTNYWSEVSSYNVTQFFDNNDVFNINLTWLNTYLQIFNNSVRIDNVNSTVQDLLSENVTLHSRINSLNNTKLDKTDQRYNDTVLIQSLNTSINGRVDNLNSTVQGLITENSTIHSRIDTVNTTALAKSSPGTCGVNQIVQNTTTVGVQCVTDQDTTYTALGLYVILVGTQFSFNETRMNATIQNLDTNCSVTGSCDNITYDTEFDNLTIVRIDSTPSFTGINVSDHFRIDTINITCFNSGCTFYMNGTDACTYYPSGGKICDI